MGCTGSHPPWLWKAFGDKAPDERRRIIEDNKLCLFCLLHSVEEVCYSRTYKTKPVCPVPEYKELYIKWPHHVMHGLPCKKEVSTGSVNMVQECESETPEDSLMVMEAAEEEAFFVKKLVEDEEEIED
jgi:hypothetical protein